MRKVYTVLALIMLGLVLIIAFQNTDVVSVQILAWEVSMSRFVLLLLTTAGGFVGGFFVAQLLRIVPK